jgi:hypothetical protein
MVNDLEDVLLAPRSVRRGEQALEVKRIRADEQVNHGLKVIEVRPADVRGDDDAVACGGFRRLRGTRGEEPGEQAE